MESHLYHPLLRALSTLFILVLCSLLCLSASAVDLNDLEVDPITSASEEERLWNVLEYRAEDVCETVTDRIVSFDVNETGWFLLALKGNQLAILDPLGRPVYRYSFAAEGTYYASWNRNTRGRSFCVDKKQERSAQKDRPRVFPWAIYPGNEESRPVNPSDLPFNRNIFRDCS